MRAYDNGCFYSVSVSGIEVQEFNDFWPCSTMNSPQWFQFDKQNGDLIDRKGRGDGPEVLALAEDAQAFGKKKLGLP